ncbi:MAG: alpha-1,2-fucosyltransferase [Ruminococcus sp.]|nr:alpha-1,2-fucosyltransferase [Ruminococcus sp.]
MIIVRIMGGLGNQLQQYALYRKLKAEGKEVRLDISWFADMPESKAGLTKRELELDYLQGITYQSASEEEIRGLLGRLWEEDESFVSKLKRKLYPAGNPVFTESDMYHENIFSFRNKYLVGYWACEKYYADILGRLRKDIRFPQSVDEGLQHKNEQIMEEMAHTDSVSLHIRRGDYLDDVNKTLFGNICKDTYYESAVTYMKERFPDARFYLFSDDIPYVREHYRGDEFTVIDWNQGKDSFYDIMLMSHCRHNICANSTFSFWGARLNPYADKIMIRPSIHKNTQICIPEQMKELWAGWTLITPQGKVL